MTQDELMCLRDVTPHIGQEVTVLPNGKTVVMPKMLGFAGALFQNENDGEFQDSTGQWWLTGMLQGERVRRKRD